MELLHSHGLIIFLITGYYRFSLRVDNLPLTLEPRKNGPKGPHSTWNTYKKRTAMNHLTYSTKVLVLFRMVYPSFTPLRPVSQTVPFGLKGAESWCPMTNDLNWCRIHYTYMDGSRTNPNTEMGAKSQYLAAFSKLQIHPFHLSISPHFSPKHRMINSKEK